MEDREFITHLIGLLDILTQRKEGNGVLPYEQSSDEEELEQNTIRVLNQLLKQQ